jgi:hypothetical protein
LGASPEVVFRSITEMVVFFPAVIAEPDISKQQRTRDIAFFITSSFII